MLSYTSSFKNCFFKKTIFMFFVISFFYYIVLSIIPKDLKGASDHQSNILKAQDFVFSDNYYPIVVVGSSELYGVPLEVVDSHVFNLAFAGGGSATGLKIIEAQEHKPKLVLVEMNDTLAREVDDDIIRKTFWWNIFPWNRENTRIDYLLIYIKNIIRPKIRQLLHRENMSDTEGPPNEDILKQVQTEYNKVFLDKAKFREKAERLKRVIDNLHEEGCHIILVEPPKDPSLYEARQMQQVRNVLQRVFPNDQYEWVTVNWSEYTTTDGLHLTKNNAKQYSMYLLSYISRYK